MNFQTYRRYSWGYKVIIIAELHDLIAKHGGDWTDFVIFHRENNEPLANTKKRLCRWMQATGVLNWKGEFNWAKLNEYLKPGHQIRIPGPCRTHGAELLYS